MRLLFLGFVTDLKMWNRLIEIKTCSLIPGPSPSFPLLTILGNGKLGEGLGTRLMYSYVDSHFYQ